MTTHPIDSLREVMGTRPQDNPPLETKYYRGVEGIKVTLIDHSVNPYKAMVTFATETWGNVFDSEKWERLTPEARFEVVSAVLQRKALPLALEVPSFTFEVSGCSRSAFDQIARARVGVTFSSMGWRDNNHKNVGFRVPERVYDEPEKLEKFKEGIEKSKEIYAWMVDEGQENWQDARASLPISALHRFGMSMNYAALSSMCGKRLMFCEQADTVAVAWLVRRRVEEKFPLLASYLRPSCDWAKRCTYHEANELSEAFGCLFKGCGRWPEADDGYATFNYACSDIDSMSEQLDFKLTGPTEGYPPKTWDELSDLDKALFTAD